MKKGNVLLIFFRIIVVIIIAVLAYFTYKYYLLYKANKAQEEEENKQAEDEAIQEVLLQAEEEEYQTFLAENVYDNTIPIALYLYENGQLQRADTVYCDWTRDSILGLFYSFPSTEETITCSDYETLWEAAWASYDTDGYKIGYNLKLHLDTGEEINRTMLEPIYVDDDIFSHIQLYMYDDVTYMPGRSYYHMSPEEMTEETLLTSIKLVGYKETKGVNGPIELTIFTYNGEEDFDTETGEYLGNSKFTVKIYREQV